ncbi:hypothetical protein [Paraburkholderia nodosa]|uniref:hypothetical protein n=1 Tax=Paraburkholderia nodosa TaxID=392320 RepID=UPI00048521CE|nr:hypothetical protein [Paraburkholderia nodosa]
MGKKTRDYRIEIDRRLKMVDWQGHEFWYAAFRADVMVGSLMSIPLPSVMNAFDLVRLRRGKDGRTLIGMFSGNVPRLLYAAAVTGNPPTRAEKIDEQEYRRLAGYWPLIKGGAA